MEKILKKNGGTLIELNKCGKATKTRRKDYRKHKRFDEECKKVNENMEMVKMKALM